MGRRDERSRSRGRSRSPRRHRSAERSRRRSRSRSRSANRAHSRRKRSYSRSSSRGRSHHRHSSRDRYSGRSSPRDSRDRRRSRSTSKERSRRSRSSSYSRSRRSRSPRRESRHRSPSYNNHHDDRRSHQDSSREHYRRDSRDRQRESSRDRHRETSRDRPREPSRDSHRNGSDSFASKQKEPPKNQESAPALVGHATPADPRRDNRGRGDIKESETHKTLSAPQQAPDQSQTHPEVRKQNLPALDTSAPPSVESTPASTPLPVFHSRPATKVTVVVPEDPAAKRRRFQREEAHRTYLKSTVLRAKAEAKFETAMAKVYLAETWLNFVDKTVEDVGRRIELQDWKFKKMDDGMSLEELLEAPATDEPEPEVTQL